jgi:hypothetical protein
MLRPFISFIRFAIVILATANIVVTSSEHGLADSVRSCGASDSAAARASEISEMNRSLPSGYHVLEIEPSQRTHLRITVPYENRGVAERSVPAWRIADKWERVLAKDHCEGSAVVVFLSPSGKELFAEAAGFTD